MFLIVNSQGGAVESPGKWAAKSQRLFRPRECPRSALTSLLLAAHHSSAPLTVCRSFWVNMRINIGGRVIVPRRPSEHGGS